MEDITDIDYGHAKRVFNNKYIGNYHDLYVQHHTLLLADVFENFRNMCLKEYKLDPAHFLSAPGLAWQACLKKTEIKLQLLTDIDMLLMYNIYIKNYDKNNESPYIQVQTIYMDGQCLENCL